MGGGQYTAMIYVDAPNGIDTVKNGDILTLAQLETAEAAAIISRIVK